MNTEARIRHRELAPDTYRALAGVNQSLADSPLGAALIDLVFLRVSQINGCAYCVDSHTRDLLKGGEDFQRINSLVTWREVSFFSARERAALNWAESLTHLVRTQAPDADFEPLKVHFSDREIADLTTAVGLMNLWNRIGVGLRLPVARKPLQGPGEGPALGGGNETRPAGA